MQGYTNFIKNILLILFNRFLSEEDEECLKKELKEAFRIYDKDGNGFITTNILKEILQELDPKLTEAELIGIIEEVDEDGSGTVDFDEFMEMMTGWKKCIKAEKFSFSFEK